MKETKILNKGMSIELRAKDSGESMLAGYAAVWDTRSSLLYDSFYEVVKKGAFKKTLGSTDADVFMFREHNRDWLLGKRTANTLRLEEDDIGLRFECDLPNTSYGNDLRELIKRGDVTHMSFGFLCRRDNWEMLEGGIRVRELWDVELDEISTTFDPAYRDSELALRSLQSMKDSPVESVDWATQNLRLRLGIQVKLHSTL